MKTYTVRFEIIAFASSEEEAYKQAWEELKTTGSFEEFQNNVEEVICQKQKK